MEDCDKMCKHGYRPSESGCHLCRCAVAKKKPNGDVGNATTLITNSTTEPPPINCDSSNQIYIYIIIVLISLTSCQRPHPGNYSQLEVETQVKKSLKLTEIKLAPDPAGGYSGSGKTADGEGFKLKITQDAVQKSLKWNAVGNRGTLEDGSFSFE